MVDDRDRNFEQAIALLEHYSFEIAGGSARGFATYWADELPSAWLKLAVLEALYLGRYKAVSVSQILGIWERKQHPQPHFNDEFERLICDRLFAELDAAESQPETTVVPIPESEIRESDNTDEDEPETQDADAAIAIEPEGTEATAIDVAIVAPHPTPIEQFVPEDSSPVYDKLRGLACPPEDSNDPAQP